MPCSRERYIVFARSARTDAKIGIILAESKTCLTGSLARLSGEPHAYATLMRAGEGASCLGGVPTKPPLCRVTDATKRI
jgi:hypothetical protein